MQKLNKFIGVLVASTMALCMPVQAACNTPTVQRLSCGNSVRNCLYTYLRNYTAMCRTTKQNTCETTTETTSFTPTNQNTTTTKPIIIKPVTPTITDITTEATTQTTTKTTQTTCTPPIQKTTSTQKTTEKQPVTTVKTTQPTTRSVTETTTETTTKSVPNTNNVVVDNSVQQQILDLVNKERVKNGLGTLTLDTNLSYVAQVKAEDMKAKNYFSHTSPTYGSPFDMMKRFGITYRTAGENIAMGQKTPQAVMTAWMNSSGHRANILNKNYTKLGVGYVYNNGRPYWVQQFTG